MDPLEQLQAAFRNQFVVLEGIRETIATVQNPYRAARLSTLSAYYTGWLHWRFVEKCLQTGVGYPYPKPGPDRAHHGREVARRLDAIEQGWEFAHEAIQAFDRLQRRLEDAGEAASMHPPAGVPKLPLYIDLQAIESTLAEMRQRFEVAVLEVRDMTPMEADNYLWHACYRAIYHDDAHEWRSGNRVTAFLYAMTGMVWPVNTLRTDINWLENELES